MSEKTPVERAAQVMADLFDEDWDPTHEDDARDMLTAAVADREGLARALAKADGWEGPLRDVGGLQGGLYVRRADAVARWLTGGGV